MVVVTECPWVVGGLVCTIAVPLSVLRASPGMVSRTRQKLRLLSTLRPSPFDLISSLSLHSPDWQVAGMQFLYWERDFAFLWGDQVWAKAPKSNTDSIFSKGIYWSKDPGGGSQLPSKGVNQFLCPQFSPHGLGHPQVSSAVQAWLSSQNFSLGLCL